MTQIELPLTRFHRGSLRSCLREIPRLVRGLRQVVSPRAAAELAAVIALAVVFILSASSIGEIIVGRM